MQIDEQIQKITDSLNVSKLNNNATVTISTNNLKIFNIIYINATQIYNLHYEEGKYQFIIEAQCKIESYNLTEIKTLDIYKGGAKSIAYCKINDKL